MTVLRLALTYCLFPVTFTGALVFAHLAGNSGMSEPVVLAIVVVIVAAIILVIERVHPEYPVWNQTRGDIMTDAAHALISQVLLPQLINISLLAVILKASVVLSEQYAWGVWPEDWPIVLQLALVLVVSQFGEYWWHRKLHEHPLLWRLHAIHHSPERLYWLNAGRFHPLDTLGSYLIASIPIGLMGGSAEVLLLLGVWVNVHGLFQHCNIHLRLGPLNYIFSMAELHRWHHSLKLEEANQNYGNNIILWDLIFGTYYNPKGRDASEVVGLSDISDFPKDYVGQLKVPFQWRWD